MMNTDTLRSKVEDLDEMKDDLDALADELDEELQELQEKIDGLEEDNSNRVDRFKEIVAEFDGINRSDRDKRLMVLVVQMATEQVDSEDFAEAKREIINMLIYP